MPPSNERLVAYEKQVGYLKDGNRKEWVSPFSPDRVDPLVAKDGTAVGFPTLSELRAVIPPHCFDRSLFWSMSYVVRDIMQGIFVWYVVHDMLELSTDPPEDGGILAWLLWRLAWNVYAFAMFVAVWGLWVIGHECGHGAFSDYPLVNDTVGWILHSAMLVPYFSWAYSHSVHHKRVNHMVEDEVFAPPPHEGVGLVSRKNGEYERVHAQQVRKVVFGGGPGQYISNILYCDASLHETVGDLPFVSIVLCLRLLFSWQIYLFGGSLDSRAAMRGRLEDHFRPHSKLFPPRMYWKVILSDVGIGITLSTLGYWTYCYGFRFVWMWYVGPYTVIHMYLVVSTWLHHTDPTVPFYDDATWDWVKGVLSGTIDRPSNFFTSFIGHNINTTHVVHHLFHEMPHYHAREATQALRAYLEPKGMYNYDPTPVWRALFTVASRCHFVDRKSGDGVQYYRSLMDVPVKSKDS